MRILFKLLTPPGFFWLLGGVLFFVADYFLGLTAQTSFASMVGFLVVGGLFLAPSWFPFLVNIVGGKRSSKALVVVAYIIWFCFLVWFSLVASQYVIENLKGYDSYTGSWRFFVVATVKNAYAALFGCGALFIYGHRLMQGKKEYKRKTGFGA